LKNGLEMQSMNDFSRRDNRNACTEDWSKWWRGFLGTPPDRDRVAIEILRQRYVEEMRMDLAEENRCADHLPEQIWRIESDHPDISTLLQQIFEAEKR